MTPSVQIWVSRPNGRRASRNTRTGDLPPAYTLREEQTHQSTKVRNRV